MASIEDSSDLTVEAPTIYKQRKSLSVELKNLIGSMELKSKFSHLPMEKRRFGDRFVRA